jgi:hypothetical protein
VTRSGSSTPGLTRRNARRAIVLLIGVAGTSTLIGLGFDAHGPLLWFMWLTCASVCFTAGIVTLHLVDVLLVVHNLQHVVINAFRYSPARTRQLRDLVSYFSSFTLLVTIGYAFAFAATLKPHWTGAPDYVHAVQLFWPVLYVPACSIALLYPHFVIHRLIQREKENTLLSCQREIDLLLVNYSGLNPEDIERTNLLANLFDRISATPDYVLDFGIALRTALPLAFNFVTLLIKPALGLH